MVRIPEGNCPCGSDKLSVDCCYQSQPPVQRPADFQITGISLQTKVQLVDVFGLPVSPWLPARANAKLNISEAFVIQDFIFEITAAAREQVMRRCPPFVVFVTEAEKEKTLYELELIESLFRNIKAAHYHLQNFVFRFKSVSEEFAKKPVTIGEGITKMVDKDFPLEFEFESYMIRYRTCVELSVKLIALKATSVDPRKKFNFAGTIDAVCKRPKDCIERALADAIARNMELIEEQRKIRNAIAHDGANNVLGNFEHVRGTTLNATVLNRTADAMTLQMFQQLTDFTRDVVQAIYAEKADAVG